VPGFPSGSVNAHATVRYPSRGVCPHGLGPVAQKGVEIDVEQCSQCGGTLKFMAIAPVITKILAHPASTTPLSGAAIRWPDPPARDQLPSSSTP
jgi:hypothetical protein